ncbi:proteinase-activated receptor 3 [Triplophysa dalaica]|uniref:proteinase-activated receptor 3 n=1 Tax=Triplophysa dalaica TaxID=1582913 RepID=UPI0024DF805E|nr:proteinase-activated receptor 3 [Triplophysa dalaica]
MGKIFFFILITLLLLHATHAKEEKQTQKAKGNATDFASPRTFQGHAIAVNIGLDGNRTHTHVLPPLFDDVEMELRSNNTAAYLGGRLSKWFIPTVYIIAIIVGIPANIAILFAVGAKVRMVSSAIMYCSLAVSDLLLLLSLLLKTHYHLNGNHWIFGETACRITTACFYGNLYCSAYTLACISIKRYMAVVHPFLYKSLPKRSFSSWCCLTIWVIFIMAILPELLVKQSYHIPQLKIITCHDVLPANLSMAYQWLIYYNLGLTCVGFFLPLVLMMTCYTSIVWHLNRSHQDWALYIRASTFNFVIFLVCFGPSSCFHFVHYVLLSTSTIENFYMYFSVTACLCCLHCALDPFLFVLMSRTVGTKRYFLAWKGRAYSIST